MQEGFVDVQELIPDAEMEIRYATDHNLTGHPLAGYKASKALMTVEGAAALAKAAEKLRAMGYGIRIYDAYRPQKAVTDFVTWSGEAENGETKEEFYPELEKSDLFPLGYIARKSGHSRGSTVDLTLTRDGSPLDMGTNFDRMSEMSHHGAAGLTEMQNANRALLRGVMAWAGFAPYENEWWHYRLMNEPYPETYFDFDIE